MKKIVSILAVAALLAICLIGCGKNDKKTITVGASATPHAEILEQVKKLFSIARTEKPDAEIVIISIKPCPRRMKDIDKLVEANRLIKDFALAQNNVRYADVFTAMSGKDCGQHPEYFREDGLHLTAEGYAVWRSVIGEYIK